MDNQNFVENGFIIDLSNSKDTLSVINELSNILEMTESKGKNICLKLRDVELSQSQILSIKALINASGSELAFIDTNVERTIESAKELGITISTMSNNFEIEKEEVSEPQAPQNESLGEENSEISENESENQPQQEEGFENNEESKEDKGVDMPVFMLDDGVSVSEDGMVRNDSDFSEYFLSTEQEVSKDVSYEIFKTEEMEQAENKELPTLYLKQTLRSGQTLSYDGNILVIGDTHPGSELIAKGDITVWGVLGGIAHAGTSGDRNAKIRALKLNAIQLRIAGIYAGRLNTENIPFIQRSNEFTPQEASIEDDKLVIKSIYEEMI